MLLSFERPAHRRLLGEVSGWIGGRCLFADLENCTVANDTGITGRSRKASPVGISSEILQDHRQDSKGTWWMPWHQESTKGVNGCDKPR